MARSLRRPGQEPPGTFTAAVPAPALPFAPTAKASWQRMERAGRSVGIPGRLCHRIGQPRSRVTSSRSATTCSSRRSATTPIAAPTIWPRVSNTLPNPTLPGRSSEECLLCHSGAPLPVPGTMNRYSPPVFAEEAISCERCHGPAEEHLRRPAPGSIVNPAKLAPAARDSICEQCHLAGVTRVLNPDKTFADFRPGRHLWKKSSPSTSAPARGPFKVISHAEQLALSACARNSAGKLWCGTCHDPHPQNTPTSRTYSARCQALPPGQTAGVASRRRRLRQLPHDPPAGAGWRPYRFHRSPHHARPQPEEPRHRNGDLVAWRDPDAGVAGTKSRARLCQCRHLRPLSRLKLCAATAC